MHDSAAPLSPRSRKATAAALIAVAAIVLVTRLAFFDRQLWWTSPERLTYGLFPHHLVQASSPARSTT